MVGSNKNFQKKVNQEPTQPNSIINQDKTNKNYLWKRLELVQVTKQDDKIEINETTLKIVVRPIVVVVRYVKIRENLDWDVERVTSKLAIKKKRSTRIATNYCNETCTKN